VQGLTEVEAFEMYGEEKAAVLGHSSSLTEHTPWPPMAHQTSEISEPFLVTSWLVVWNMFFPYLGNVIIPIDELIFFRGVGQPPTR